MCVMQCSLSSLVEIYVVGFRTDGKSKFHGMQRSQPVRGIENIEEILDDLGKERHMCSHSGCQGKRRVLDGHSSRKVGAGKDTGRVRV